MASLLYNRSFPTPAYLAMNSFALDVSDQSIKYGELIPSPYGLRLGRFNKEKIPKDVVVSGLIRDEHALVRILSTIQAREDMKFVRVSLPEEQMYLFTLSLPQIPELNLRDAILLQLEEHIPISAIDTIFDYEVLLENEETIVVEVVASARATIESYMSVLERAGLVPLSFEIEAQAIARAVIPRNDPSPVMIIDFGQSRTGISIASGGRVVFTTTIDIGGQTLTQMIAKNFKVSLEEAELMKHAYGIGDDGNINEIFPVIVNGISVLRDEVNKHYVYWKTHENDQLKHNPINRIILCGAGSNLFGIAEYLETSMRMNVIHANPWVNISSTEFVVPEMSFEESLGYVTILGLALGDYMYD
jgi:type IV pilus assembly protein PilM